MHNSGEEETKWQGWEQQNCRTPNDGYEEATIAGRKMHNSGEEKEWQGWERKNCRTPNDGDEEEMKSMPEGDHVWSAQGCARDNREVMATAAETALWAAAMGGDRMGRRTGRSFRFA